MFFPESTVRVYVYTEPVDMRKSFTGLYALTKHELGEDPVSGSLFVFCNRSGTYMKVLYFDRHGFCIWSKKLEAGRFKLPSGERKQTISYTELKLILEGIEMKDVRRGKRFRLPE